MAFVPHLVADHVNEWRRTSRWADELVFMACFSLGALTKAYPPSLLGRLEVDEPLGGYLVRTEREGWLQGFVVTTSFVTYHRRS